jgi:hypothetical protein
LTIEPANLIFSHGRLLRGDTEKFVQVAQLWVFIGRDKAVSDTWGALFQQLLMILSKMAEKLIQGALGWSLLIVWLAVCLFGINWKKTWAVLAQGAWAPLLLAMVLSALAWSQMTPASPRFWWRLGLVSLIVVASFLCGSVQGYFGWQPAEINLEPTTPEATGHGHEHH